MQVEESLLLLLLTRVDEVLLQVHLLWVDDIRLAIGLTSPVRTCSCTYSLLLFVMFVVESTTFWVIAFVTLVVTCIET